MGSAKNAISDTWCVLPHGSLEQLAENLWWTWGSLPRMSLKRSMTVAKRHDGKLVLHSAIAMDEASMIKLESLGEPAFLIVPNRGHRLDAPAYKKRYPKLRVFTPRGGRDAVAEVVHVDGTYEDFPADDTVHFESLHGVKDLEGAMIVRSQDGLTLVLNDTVMNMDRKKDPLGFLFTTVMGSAPGPRVSRFGQLMFVDDKQALRADLERYADLPNLQRLIVSHEKVTHGPSAGQALHQAATYL